MMKRIRVKDSRGMGVTETFLLLIIIALLGFIGWYVFAKSSDTKNKLDETSLVNSQPLKSSTKYFTFKEYSVKIPQTDSLKNLSYTAKQTTVNDAASTSLFLNDSGLAKSIDDCNTTKGSSGNFAAISKANGQFPADPTPDTGGLLKQFDSFYISSSYPNGIPCEDNTKEDAVVAQMKNLQKALVEAFKNAQKTD